MIIEKIKTLVKVCMVIILILILALLIKDNIHISRTKSPVTISAVTSKTTESNMALENQTIVQIIDPQNLIEDENEAIEKEEPIDAVNDVISSKPQTQENKITTDVKYYIKVNYLANVVTIYTKDNNGKYTVPYKAMVCSTGSATPHSGTYTVPSGYRAKGTWGLMVGGVYAQYYTRIVGSILFHSVPYTKQNKSSLEYWEYDKLGTTASAGCVRLTVQDAKWIYNNCPAGTQVEFYADSNPGPLGKPNAKKISGESDIVKNWDPTDPDSNNPWKNYTKDQNKTTENKNNTSQKNTTQNDKYPNNTSKENTTTENTNKENSKTDNTIKDNTNNDKDSQYNAVQDNTSNDSTENNNLAQDNVSKSDIENNIENNENTIQDNEIWLNI